MKILIVFETVVIFLFICLFANDPSNKEYEYYYYSLALFIFYFAAMLLTREMKRR